MPPENDANDAKQDEKKVEAESSESKELDRRSAIVGMVTGFVGGGAAGFFGASLKAEPETPPPPPPRPLASAPKPPPPPGDGGAPGEGVRIPINQAHPSFAQQGEDIVAYAMLRDAAGIKVATYLDVGAFDPIESNNTYLLNILGGHGVLVEPNPVMAERLRKERGARDTVLEVGVGLDATAEADYYVFENDGGQLNTFSKAQAEVLQKKGAKLAKVLKRKLVKMNDILAEHFKDRAPDFLSLDVEGLDLDILKSMDFEKWRPIVICVETSEVATGNVEKDILELLVKKGYEVRGGSFVNTMFLDRKAREKKKG